jgi:hypothetical protein
VASAFWGLACGPTSNNTIFMTQQTKQQEPYESPGQIHVPAGGGATGGTRGLSARRGCARPGCPPAASAHADDEGCFEVAVRVLSQL